MPRTPSLACIGPAGLHACMPDVSPSFWSAPSRRQWLPSRVFERQRRSVMARLQGALRARGEGRGERAEAQR